MDTIKKIEIICKNITQNFISGNYKSKFKGYGMDFVDIREYAYGDDIRMINWNVSAKSNIPYVNILSEDRQTNVFLIVDVSKSMQNHNIIDIVQKIYSLLLYSANYNDDNFGVLFFDSKVKSFINYSKGKNHFYKLYDFLTENQQLGQEGSNIDVAIREFLKRIRKKSVVFVISDFMMQNYQNEVRMLSKNNDVILIKIDNFYHYNFPSIGYADLIDNETSQVLNSFGLSENFRNKFEKHFDNKTYIFNKFCKKYKVSNILINYDDNPYYGIIKFFRQRKRI